MDFAYVGYNEAREIVKGVISTSNEETAVEALGHRGYRVLSLKPATAFMPNWRDLFPNLFRIKPNTILKPHRSYHYPFLINIAFRRIYLSFLCG